MEIPLLTSPTLHLKFAHERCVTSSWSTQGNSCLNKSKTFIKWAIPLKDLTTCSCTDIYHMCRTCHLHWKGQCATEIQLLNTPHDWRCCHSRQAMTQLWCSSINTHCFSQKTGAWTFVRRVWGRQRYLPPTLRGQMAMPMVIPLDSRINLLLISRILVDTNGNVQHHVTIGISHG